MKLKSDILNLEACRWLIIVQPPLMYADLPMLKNISLVASYPSFYSRFEKWVYKNVLRVYNFLSKVGIVRIPGDPSG